MAALSSSSVFISYILITQPLVYCLRKKCKIYYSLYCTTTCIISRDESLNSDDNNSTLLPAFLFGCVVYASATHS